jgi:thiol reductant ABC exporter CydC subunit
MRPRTAEGAFRARFGVAMAAGTGALACALGLVASSAWLISQASGRPQAHHLLVAIVAVQVFGLGRCVLRYAERLTAHDAALRLLASARVRLYERLAALAPAGLHGWRYGRLLRLLAGSADGIADRRLTATVPLAAASFAGLAVVAFEWWLLPGAGVALLAALLTGGVAAPWGRHRLAVRAERRVTRHRSDLAGMTRETLRGLPELIACGAAPQRLHGMRRVDTALCTAERRPAWTAGLGSAMTVLATGAAVPAALLLGAHAVRGGRLDATLLPVVVLIPLASVETAGALAAAARQALRSRADSALLRAVLHVPDPATGPVEPAEPLPVPPAVPAPRIGGAAGLRDATAGRPGYALSLRGLRAVWPGTDGENLTGLDLELPPGRRVAVVRSDGGGAGQSTLVAVLLRLLDYEGSVTLNGVELRDLAGDDVRGIIGLCTRGAHVFDATAADNVRIAEPGANDAEVSSALRRAGLGSWQAALPDGLATRLGEHGRAVSGGERLRIALARALLADFPVLILDEPEPCPDQWPDLDNCGRPGADGAVPVDQPADLLAATAGRTVLLVTRRGPTPGADAMLRRVDEVITLG